MKINPTHKASCHCGAVQFTLQLPQGLQNLRRCNCSFCRRRGSVVASVPMSDLTIEAGQSTLSNYQFNTATAQHYFCSICGIYTHHRMRADPSQVGFNVACLDDVNPFELGDIPVSDGINHVSDRR